MLIQLFSNFNKFLKLFVVNKQLLRKKFILKRKNILFLQFRINCFVGTKLYYNMKKKHLIIYIFIFLLCSIFSNNYALATLYTDSVFDKNIKTVQFYNSENVLSYPILQLNTNTSLTLAFDYLIANKEVPDLSYKIFHCNYNWQLSNLYSNEYITGFEENDIYTVTNSFNTFCNYTHFSCILPNENISIIYPGNYIIQVYNSGNDNQIVLTKRFYVAENKTDIEVNCIEPQNVENKRTGQQINFSIANTHISNINQGNIAVQILQNGTPVYAQNVLKPSFIDNGHIYYNNQEMNVFKGENEFYIIDTKNVKFAGLLVDSVSFIAPFYHFFGTPLEENKYKLYKFRQDFNGKYFIKSDKAFDLNTETDYAWVYFNVKHYNMDVEGDLYIFGELTNWKLAPENKLVYNFNTGLYTTKLFLKQGLYNFALVFVNKKSGAIDKSYLEGSHYETENDYHILIYELKPGNSGDKIIGYKHFNTQKKL